MTSIQEFPIRGDIAADRDEVPDCVVFPDQLSAPARLGVLAAGLAAGIAGGFALKGAADPGQALWGVIGLAAVAGGVLSTWSPCGYSSISLLRASGKGLQAAVGYIPTFAAHGLGHAAGALILGSLLGALGAILGFAGFATGFGLSVLALIGLAYGAHQLDFLRVPYPQRRAQVPHDARQRFPKWVVGALYGLSLGLDYLTYVRDAAAVYGDRRRRSDRQHHPRHCHYRAFQPWALPARRREFPADQGLRDPGTAWSQSGTRRHCRRGDPDRLARPCRARGRLTASKRPEFFAITALSQGSPCPGQGAITGRTGWPIHINLPPNT
ncbi:hypothetical protein PE067_18950 [Paracoccus sp. DMF-8]|uniref:hypothetical protein n=1 Tax=Paracoccus sp. DMF-8 TaxID=3019445 RepID=UPI0023E367C1|nr:hypothetical protein [Paracoccus sp. DMF-8]MDF3608023.1 hypothetical protein [Paracoccus sp. DMF-8]